MAKRFSNALLAVPLLPFLKAVRTLK